MQDYVNLVVRLRLRVKRKFLTLTNNVCFTDLHLSSYKVEGRELDIICCVLHFDAFIIIGKRRKSYNLRQFLYRCYFQNYFSFLYPARNVTPFFSIYVAFRKVMVKVSFILCWECKKTWLHTELVFTINILENLIFTQTIT